MDLKFPSADLPSKLPHPAAEPETWEGCYAEGWQGWIVPAAFQHPAKFSRLLVERIVHHGFDLGLWKRGDTLGDPFGGVGCGGIVATNAGLAWIGVELEPRFVHLAEENFALHREMWERTGRAQPRVLQGDSRNFAELVGGLGGVVCSPPYNDNQRSDRTVEARNQRRAFRQGAGSFRTSESYGRSPGQVGGLPGGSLAGVISSPPFTSDQPCASQTRLGRRIGSREKRDGSMQSPGNVQNSRPGGLAGVVTSPPWGTNCEGGIGTHRLKNPADFALGMVARGGNRGSHSASVSARQAQFERDASRTYGRSPGQVGGQTGETYWQACAQIYASSLRAIRPGGHLVVVVKDYVKRKQRITLCEDTCSLLVHLGFRVTQRIRAMLVEETREGCLFEGERVQRRQRKSFFRRLAESKGSPRIDWEEVIFATVPPEGHKSSFQ